jgi:hypothetical protein
MASSTKNSRRPTKPQETEVKSSVFQLIERYNVADEERVFAIKLPKEGDFMRFRLYESVEESAGIAAEAKNFSRNIVHASKQDPAFIPFVNLDKSLIDQCYVLGKLAVDYGTSDFMQIATKLPTLFEHIQVAVDEALYGNDWVIFKAGVDASKKNSKTKSTGSASRPRSTTSTRTRGNSKVNPGTTK